MDARHLDRSQLECIVDCFERGLCFDTALVLADVKGTRYVSVAGSDGDIRNTAGLWEEDNTLSFED